MQLRNGTNSSWPLQSNAHNGTRAAESFAVTLLRQNCEHVPVDVVTSAFACPSTMIVAACLALVAAELYKFCKDAKTAAHLILCRKLS